MGVNAERDTADEAGRRFRRRSLWVMTAAAVLTALVGATAVALVGEPPPRPSASDERRLEPITGKGGDPLPLHTLPAFSDGPAVDVGDYVGAPLVVNLLGDVVRSVRAVDGIGMPTTLLVGAEGVVRYRHTGELTERKLRALLREHLAVS